MNSEQVQHLARIRVALRDFGIDMDVQLASFDPQYLNEMLVRACDHPSREVQESAYVLGASFGLSGSEADGTVRQPRAEMPMLVEFTSDEIATAQSEPAGFAFSAERDAIMRRYVAGLR